MESSVFACLGNIFVEPKKALGDFREHNHWLWYPLLITMAVATAVLLWYYATADLGVLQQQVMEVISSRYSAGDLETIRATLTRGRFLFQAAMGGTLGVVLVCLIQALYFFLVSKLAGYEVQDYGRWFSFSVWTYFPNVLAYLTAGVAYLLSSRQTDFFAIDVTNLNTLLFRVSPDSRWFSLAASIHLTTFWWLALMIMGFSLWTKKSPGKSAFIVLAPWLTIYAVFALVKLI